MKSHLSGLVFLLVVALSAAGCGSFEPTPAAKGRATLKAPQTGSNIRRLEGRPASSGRPGDRAAKKKKATEKKAKPKKPGSGVVDENYVPRGGFR